MKSVHRLTIVLVGFTLLAGGRASPFAIGEPSRIWKRSVLRACWLDGAAPVRKHVPTWGDEVDRVDGPTRERRAFVEKVVRANFTKSLTGIALAPFEDCPRGSAIAKFDVLLGAEVRVKDDDGDTFGRSSIGDEKIDLDSEGITYLEIPKEDRRSFVGLSLKNESEDVAGDLDGFFETLDEIFPESLTRSSTYAAKVRAFRAKFQTDRYRLTVVHEFGHLFGLRHEEARRDTPVGIEIPFCTVLASDLRISARSSTFSRS